MLDEYLARFDGLVLQGGDDVCPLLYGDDARTDITVDCERDRFEVELSRRFIDAGKPILGICRGMQLLNVVMGGTLSQDVSGSIAHMLDHQRNGCHLYAHRIDIGADTLLADIAECHGSVPVNSFHRQGIRDLGQGLAVDARSSDGLPEAISLIGRDDVIGVQWHPEWLNDAISTRIFAHFATVCARGGVSTVPRSAVIERMNTTEMRIDLDRKPI